MPSAPPERRRQAAVAASAGAARRSPEDQELLARLVGRTRARVLAALQQPRTTDEVARLVGAATSTASEHLTALQEAGVLTRRRLGRHVYYELSERGRSLVELLRER